MESGEWQSGNAAAGDNGSPKTRGVASRGQGPSCVRVNKRCPYENNGLMERVGGKAASSSGRGRTRPESAGRITLRLRSGQAALQKGCCERPQSIAKAATLCAAQEERRRVRGRGKPRPYENVTGRQSGIPQKCPECLRLRSRQAALKKAKCDATR